MKTIKFGSNSYQLACGVVRDSAMIRVTIYKEDYTLSDIAQTVSGIEAIEVYDEDTLIVTYAGFTLLSALNLYNDYPVNGGLFVPVISIELVNTNIQLQIDALNRALESVVSEQRTMETEISDIGDAVNSLTDSQETQDHAIEDLAEAVNDLTPEEE